MSAVQRAFILVAILTLGPCAQAQSASIGLGRTLGIGRWGQHGVVLQIRSEGISLFDVCFGIGKLNGPIVLDGHGRFDVDGTFRVNNPVPETPYRPARFVGQVHGSHLAVTVISLDPEVTLVRSYSLRRGVGFGDVDCGDE